MAGARLCLCHYFSPDRGELLLELCSALLAGPLADQGPAAPAAPSAADGGCEEGGRVRMLLVPHGAACDGFVIAAHAYCALAASLRARRCGRLTAVVLGTDHFGSPGPRVVVSSVAWETPLGLVPCDAAAAAWLAAEGGVPVSEAPHRREHSIENQLPLLQLLAAHRWDARAAAAAAPAAGPGEERGGGGGGGGKEEEEGGGGGLDGVPGGTAAARLRVVPISVGYLGTAADAEAAAGAVAALIARLEAGLQQGERRGPQAGAAPGGGGARSSGGGGGGGGGWESELESGGGREPEPRGVAERGAADEVVLIATSDYTHAGPGYGEVPPAGESLEAYMWRQDEPVLRAVESGDPAALTAAAARTRNSMCGLAPLAVALRAARLMGWGPPRRLRYAPAHLLYARPDSTGFAAHVAYG